MKFEIRRVQNGAVLRVESEGEDSGEEIVYQEQEDDEIEAFAEKDLYSSRTWGQIRATSVTGCA